MSQGIMPPRLLIADCSRAAAKYAVMHWHYSKQMPVGRLVTLGVWEADEFIGAVIFGRGGNNRMAGQLGLLQTECCELVRIALTNHASPVSQIVARALRRLSEGSPGLRAVVSYADPAQGHLGTIYQAGNWAYTGQTGASSWVYFEGRWWHPRNLNPTGFGTYPGPSRLPKSERAGLPRRQMPGKFRYIYSFDRAMRRRVNELALPYPHADEVSEARRLVSNQEGRVRSPASALGASDG